MVAVLVVVVEVVVVVVVMVFKIIYLQGLFSETVFILFAVTV